MSRTERLFDLLQLLRRHRYAVSGKQIAESLGVSLRTVYRDIATLQAQGAQIDGEPGIGYVLKPGFLLPPLMFLEDEIEALVLGMRWVADRADHALRQAALNAQAKIAAVLPSDLKEQLEGSGLLVAPGQVVDNNDETLADIRYAIRHELICDLQYHSLKGENSRRQIWPLGIGYFDEVRLLIAWCELRKDFRHFRTDKIKQIATLETHYPKRRQTLLSLWKEQQKYTK